MRKRSAALVIGVVAVAIAAGGTAAEAVATLPTESSGTITQVTPITVGTAFPSPSPVSGLSHSDGPATPVKAAGPQDVGPGRDLRDDGSHTPDGTGDGFHHDPGHGGHGGSGGHHGNPVHAGNP